MDIKLKTLGHFDSNLGLPTYHSEQAAGADIKACLSEEKKIVLRPGQRIAVPTGISVEIPVGYEIQVRPRSGLSLKSPLLLLNSPGTIDADFRGEIKILVGNFGNEDFTIEHGMRIAQLVVAPVEQVNWCEVETLNSSSRAHQGFGSTGLN